MRNYECGMGIAQRRIATFIIQHSELITTFAKNLRHGHHKIRLPERLTPRPFLPLIRPLCHLGRDFTPLHRQDLEKHLSKT